MSAPESTGRPLVSIVTPSLNMGRFLEETIESVLLQDYPNVEYLVMDGGSTDETPRILERYAGRLRFVIAPDQGAADAINAGFERTSGEIFAWLSADDLYRPRAISAAVETLQANPAAAGVYGDAEWIDESGAFVGRYPTEDFEPQRLARECFISQPASFVRRSAFDSVGKLDPTLHYTFDYEFWMRLARGYEMRRIPVLLAASRMHRSNKSLSSRCDVFQETLRILQLHYGYVPFSWLHSYACFRMDGRDQFFEPLQPSVPKYLLSLALGLKWNAGHRIRYIREWAGVMTWGGFRRHLLPAGLRIEL